MLAIVRLHNYEIVVGDAEPGCLFELLCHPPEMLSDTEPAPVRSCQGLRVRAATQGEFPRIPA